MPFEVPEAQFDANLHARKSVIKANHVEREILNLFLDAYHEFWGVSDPPNGSLYSVEQMQAKIDAIGQQQSIQILTSAAGLVAYINQSYPNAVAAKYATAAFNYTIGQNGLTITGLKTDWEAPIPEPEPEPQPEPDPAPEGGE